MSERTRILHVHCKAVVRGRHPHVRRADPGMYNACITGIWSVLGRQDQEASSRDSRPVACAIAAIKSKEFSRNRLGSSPFWTGGSREGAGSSTRQLDRYSTVPGYM